MTEPNLYTEPIIAVRAWNRGDYGLLHSLTNDFTWFPDTVHEARCMGGAQAIVREWRVDVTQDVYGGSTMEMNVNVLLTDPAALRRGIILRYDERGAFIELVPDPDASPPPHPDHRCGLYALSHAPRSTEEEATRCPPPYSRRVVNVWGVVELTGRVVPAHHGWRAQRARIICITEGPDEVKERYDTGPPPPLTDPLQFAPSRRRGDYPI